MASQTISIDSGITLNHLRGERCTQIGEKKAFGRYILF